MKIILKFSLIVLLGITTILGCKEKEEDPFVDEI